MKNDFEVIIIGGSYAGLSAAMALGRSLRNTLIIDSGTPCNRQTPYSHNFLTQDGKSPQRLLEQAKSELDNYATVRLRQGQVSSGQKTSEGFEIVLESGEKFTGRKLIFATGIKDLMPDIEGFAQCWGISVLHCPYCHGYEVRNTKTAILAQGEMAYEFAKMISHWTSELSILTNGEPLLNEDQRARLKSRGILVEGKAIATLQHNGGKLSSVVFKDGSQLDVKVLYAKLPFVQHSNLPQLLGCEINEQGFIATDGFQKTTIAGVYACGDSTSGFRSVANAVASGNLAGAMLNRELIEEDF